MIELDSEVLNDWPSVSSREWLETNGIGGYASSSLAGAHTRRYHGLLVAATRPPLGRMVLLSKFEETLVVAGQRFELSCNRYPGSIHPDGYRYLAGFRLDPFPVWTFRVDRIEIEKKLFMVNGENTTVISWKIKNKSAVPDLKCKLELRPLLAFRDHHHLRREDGGFDGSYASVDGLVSFRPNDEMPVLHLAHNAADIEPAGHWYRDFEYAIEQERGFNFREDLFQPLVLRFDLSEAATVIASTNMRTAADAVTLEKNEIERRERLLARSGAATGFTRQLALAADQFIVERGEGKTVIAGYPWFSDWGRDTMIALPGLTLATGRPEIAKSILTEFAKHVSDGMLPNRFPDEGETPEYNTVDATLWYFEAIAAYVEATGDERFVRDVLYEKLLDIVDRHIRGTRYGIGVDADGLLNAGEPGVQLTWMDAKIGDWVVTPRTGKPVEIQALWYNALCIMADLARRLDDDRSRTKYSELAEVARRSFNTQFWYAEGKYLFDCINGDTRDASLRPNQIFAVSLRHSMLAGDRAKKVAKKVVDELLTPVGLRSLAAGEAGYVPVYSGSPAERDAAYHQGTVWSWLIGPCIDAYRRTHPAGPATEKRICEMLSGFERHLREAAIGQISEIFDAEAPHLPRGCFAQAWSVAEVLRVLHPR